MDLEKDSAALDIPFFMADDTDHITGKTGLSPTVTISKDGGSFAAPSGAVSEIANGWYKIAGNATDTNTVGALLIHATGTDADDHDSMHQVKETIADQVWDDDNSLRTTTDSAGDALRLLGTSDGTAQSGTASTIQLATGADSNDDYYNFQLVAIVDGVGAGQCRRISDYTGSTRTATVDVNWITNPDNTSKYLIIADAEDTAAGGGPVTLTTASEDAVRDKVKNMLIDGEELFKAIALIRSFCCGESDGGGKNFKDPTGVTNRLQYTTDVSNNRTAVTATPPSS